MVSEGRVLDLILLESVTCKSLKVCGHGLSYAVVSWRKCSGLLKPTQVVEYVLTIAVSLASGTDALFSLLPVSAQIYKLAAEIGLALLLVVLNLRGMQESIRFLAPIVVGFFVVHALLIVFGIGSETGRFVGMWDNANASIRSLSARAARS